MYESFVLATDMDGTLIGGDHRVPERNKAAIEKFVAMGGTFLVATGRSPLNVGMYIHDLPINAPCIFFNGGALYDWREKRFLETAYLPKEGMLPFFEDCIRDFPKMCIQIFAQDALYIITDPENNDDYVNREKQPFYQMPASEIPDIPWMKVLLNDVPEHLELCKKWLAERGLTDNMDFFLSSPIFLELVGKDVSKGNMLRKLSEFSAYQGKRFISMGDFQNDVEMLRIAELGVAPSNADAYARAAADLVLPVSNVDGAVAYVIEKILPSLKKEG